MSTVTSRPRWAVKASGNALKTFDNKTLPREPPACRDSDLLYVTLNDECVVLILHLRGEQHGSHHLEDLVPRLIGWRNERDDIGDAEERDDHQEGLGGLPVLLVLVEVAGPVGAQLGNHHLTKKRPQRLLLSGINRALSSNEIAFRQESSLTNGRFVPAKF